MRSLLLRCALAPILLLAALVPIVGSATEAGAIDPGYAPLAPEPILPGGQAFGANLDPETGHIHVTNTTTDRVDVFTSQGQFVESYGALQFDGLPAAYPADVAFTGDSIYVTYWETKIVARYDRTTKNLLGSVTVAGPVGLDAADGEVYVADRSAGLVRVYDESLNELRTHQHATSPCGHRPNDVAVHGEAMYVTAHKLGSSCREHGIWATPRLFGQTGAQSYDEPRISTEYSYMVDTSDEGTVFATDSSGFSVYVNDQLAEQVYLGVQSTGIAVDPSGLSAWIIRRSGSGELVGATKAFCEGQMPTVVGTSADDTIDLTIESPGQIVWLGDGIDTVLGDESQHTICDTGDLPCETVGAATVVSDAVITQRECDALAAIREAMPGAGGAADDWTPIELGGSADPCAWYGVFCGPDPSSGTERIERLVLLLNGPGTIPPEVGDFGALRYLDVWGDGITGTLPPEIADLESLYSFTLVAPNLDAAGLLDTLTELDGLQRLAVAEVQIGAALDARVLASWPELRSITLQNTGMGGDIGEIFASVRPDVERLWLAGNVLTGPMPQSYDRFTDLSVLSLGRNPLTPGPVPGALADIDTLTNLQLYGTGRSGRLPAALFDAPALEALYLQNNHLTGAIPDRLRDLEQLRLLDLSGNALQGSIPGLFRSLTNLEMLNLSNNELGDWIADEITEIDSLAYVALHGNRCFEADAATFAFLADRGPNPNSGCDGGALAPSAPSAGTAVAEPPIHGEPSLDDLLAEIEAG